MIRLSIVIGVLILAGGCASKPKPPSPQIQSSVRSRLSDYSAAWFAGNARGVAGSFVARTPEEVEFAQALGRLATAQQALLKEQPWVPEAIAITVQMSETEPMVTLNRPWHFYAYSAARTPIHMTRDEDAVVVEMIKSGQFTFHLFNIDGRWLIDPRSWAVDRPVTVLTDSLRRQIVLTNNATEAIRAKEWERLRGVLQQMHQQRMVDRISDSTTLTMP